MRFRDPQSKLELLPERTEDGTPLSGLRVERDHHAADGSLLRQIDASPRLRIEWRSDIHLFSEWKEIDGLSYPSRTVGVKKKDGKIWYQTDILEIERLSELPPEFSR